jgi:hypothetical protein
LAKSVAAALDTLRIDSLYDYSTTRSKFCRRLLAKRFAAAMDARRIDAACDYATRRSEFCRRLLAKNLAAAMEAVRIDSLCKWLHTTYADFSGEEFREALELEFLQAFPPAPDPLEEEGHNKNQQTPTWIKYSEACEILDCDTSTITVYVRDGKLKSNGEKHKNVRVTKESVALLKLERDLKKPDRKKADKKNAGKKNADKNDGKKEDPPMDNNPARPTLYEKATQMRLQSAQDD